MRVGHPHLAGFQLRRLLLAAVLLLVLPATATAQEPEPEPELPRVQFTQAPSGVRPSVEETVAFADVAGAERYTCALDGPEFGPCTSPVTVAPLAPEVSGSRVLAVRALSAEGTRLAEGTASWVVDADAPEVRFADGPTGEWPTGASAVSFSSGSDTVLVECSTDRGVTYTRCSSPHPVTVAEGPGELRVRATDAVGNVGGAVRTWTGVAPPAEPTITGGPSGRTSARTASFAFSAAGAERFECALGATFTPCTSPLELTDLLDGSHRLRVRGIDSTGTPGLPALREWTVDGTAPSVAFADRPQAVEGTASFAARFTVDDPDATLRCVLDEAPLASCTPGATIAGTVAGAGRHTLSVTATDALNNSSVASIAWEVIEADFDWAPAAAVAGRPVTFTSRSSGPIAQLAWDLDGDGQFDDMSGPVAERTFAEAGVHKVGLQARHATGATDEAVAEVAVGRTPLTVPPGPPTEAERRPPVAAFGVAPQAPVAGQEVTLTSTSSDSDGSIAATTWDLDGDGAFDDAGGPSATRAFPAGVQSIGLRVVDSDGLAATAFATITVAAAPGTPAPPPPVIGPKALKLLTPFPTVRIAGTAVGRRIRLRILAVKAPRNTTVEIRCSGRGCPFKLDRHRVGGKPRIVRVRRLEGRPLRAGIVLEIRVHAPGRVGKYTRLFMRSGAAPKRTDACVSETRPLKINCPA